MPFQPRAQACGHPVPESASETRPPSFFNASEIATSSGARFEELISVELEEAQKALASSHRKILHLVAKNREVRQHIEKEFAQLRAENICLNDKTPEWDDFLLSFTVSKEEWNASEPNSIDFDNVSTKMQADHRDDVVFCEQLPVPTRDVIDIEQLTVSTPVSDAQPDVQLSVGPKTLEVQQQGTWFAVTPSKATTAKYHLAADASPDSEVLGKRYNNLDRNSCISASSEGSANTVLVSSAKKEGIVKWSEGEASTLLLPLDLNDDEVSEDQDDKRGSYRFRPSCQSVISVLSEVADMNHVESHRVAKVWTQAKTSAQVNVGTASRRMRRASSSSLVLQGLGMIRAEGFLSSKLKCYVIHPHSTERLIWDLVSLIVVWYDLVFIPLQFFNPPLWDFVNIVSWMTRIFWTLDVVVSFSSGFIRNDGAVEMRIPKIARQYCVTWLALDLTLILADWSEVFFGGSGNANVHDDVGGYIRLGKASRFFRMFRMIRLLRLARIRIIFRNVTERLQSERLIIAADIIKMVIVIAAVAHLVACFWYGLSAAQKDRLAWIYATGYDDKNLGFRYTTSLHWSLSQFAGGMDEVTPHCVEERIFAICAFMMGFVMAAVSISSITSSMTQLHIIGSKQSQQLSTLRRYLVRNRISNTLSMRVQRNAKHALVEQHRFMSEGSVELLTMVSEPLRAELHFEIYSPILSYHPFLRKYIEECPQVMRKVCHSAVSLSWLSPGDILFSAGEVPAEPKMYIVSDGNLIYSSMSGNRQQVGKGSCIAEATLWTEWCHRGVLSAESECRLLMLNAASFQNIATRFEHCWEADPATYAREFVESLNMAGSEVEDIMVPETRKSNHVLSSQGVSSSQSQRFRKTFHQLSS